ncbi:MAG: hypothetical protein NTY61_00695 [Candidatus Parcubacteria bacterium]|nr:hypothetical protein [Candidatus Parcubacteria bacterium]
MKLRAVIEVALPESEHRLSVENAQRDLAMKLPRTIVIKSVEYIPEPEDLRVALKRLLRLRLEGAPEYFTKLSGYSKGDEEAPFFSEGFLYPLLGKGNARTVLTYIDKLILSAGLDPDDLEQEVTAELIAEEEEEKARLAHRKKFLAEHGRK